MWETWVWSLGWEDPLRRAGQPTPVFWPGESHGQRSLMGYSPWDCRVGYNWSGLSAHMRARAHTHTHSSPTFNILQKCHTIFNFAIPSSAQGLCFSTSLPAFVIFFFFFFASNHPNGHEMAFLWQHVNSCIGPPAKEFIVLTYCPSCQRWGEVYEGTTSLEVKWGWYSAQYTWPDPSTHLGPRWPHSMLHWGCIFMLVIPQQVFLTFATKARMGSWNAEENFPSRR